MKRVLFLCTGNSCRSQMAEAWLRHHGGQQFEVFSAGLEPHPIHPLTRRVLEEQGLDISQQRSKDVTEYLGRERFDYVIIVCSGAAQACPSVFPGVNERLFWPFEDPAGLEGSEEEKLAKFREVRDQIETRIRDWVAETAAV